MKPAAPAASYADEERIKRGIPLRKLYHNCAGNHLALLLLQQEFGEDMKDYWKPDAGAQKKVSDTICRVSEVDEYPLMMRGTGYLRSLIKLGCLKKETEERLLSLNPYIIQNDNGMDMGHRGACLW